MRLHPALHIYGRFKRKTRSRFEEVPLAVKRHIPSFGTQHWHYFASDCTVCPWCCSRYLVCVRGKRTHGVFGCHRLLGTIRLLGLQERLRCRTEVNSPAFDHRTQSIDKFRVSFVVLYWKIENWHGKLKDTLCFLWMRFVFCGGTHEGRLALVRADRNVYRINSTETGNFGWCCAVVVLIQQVHGETT